MEHGSRPAGERVNFAAVVVNPARVRGLRRLRELCERAADAYGWAQPRFLRTTSWDPGTGAARSAIEAGAQLVIAVGGDGTVHACTQALACTPVPLAIVPSGTANLTARALRLPGRADAALAVAFGGRSARIDLAMADGTWFTAMAGIGLDAAIVAATPAAAKRLAGWPSYAGAALGQLLRPPATFTIRLDAGEPLIRRARSVTVGNSGALPGGVPIMPAARLDDGLLDVVILAPQGLPGWVRIGARVVRRSGKDDRQLERHRASVVEISADADLPRQVDGEVIAAGRSLTASVLPGALLVRVPGGSAASRAWPAG
jgi:diacylglycerol kinase family enzyme